MSITSAVEMSNQAVSPEFMRAPPLDLYSSSLREACFGIITLMLRSCYRIGYSAGVISLNL